MKLAKTILLLFVLVVSAVSWIVSTNKKNKTHALQFVVPKGWPQPIYDFKQNPVTQEGFDLGKKLFYDGLLRKDENFPCASFHQQYAAFATYNHTFSHVLKN